MSYEKGYFREFRDIHFVDFVKKLTCEGVVFLPEL